MEGWMEEKSDCQTDRNLNSIASLIHRQSELHVSNVVVAESPVRTKQPFLSPVNERLQYLTLLLPK